MYALSCITEGVQQSTCLGSEVTVVNVLSSFVKEGESAPVSRGQDGGVLSSEEGGIHLQNLQGLSAPEERNM